MLEDVMNEVEKARAEGVFQGKVLTALENLEKKLTNFEASLTTVTSDLKAKAAQADLEKVELKVDWILKVLWTGLGALAAAQAIVGYLLANS